MSDWRQKLEQAKMDAQRYHQFQSSSPRRYRALADSSMDTSREADTSTFSADERNLSIQSSDMYVGNNTDSFYPTSAFSKNPGSPRLRHNNSIDQILSPMSSSDAPKSPVMSRSPPTISPRGSYGSGVYSSNSIIRRVEEEIESARRAAAAAKSGSPVHDHSSYNNSNHFYYNNNNNDDSNIDHNNTSVDETNNSSHVSYQHLDDSSYINTSAISFSKTSLLFNDHNNSINENNMTDDEIHRSSFGDFDPYNSTAMQNNEYNNDDNEYDNNNDDEAAIAGYQYEIVNENHSYNEQHSDPGYQLDIGVSTDLEDAMDGILNVTFSEGNDEEKKTVDLTDLAAEQEENSNRLSVDINTKSRYSPSFAYPNGTNDMAVPELKSDPPSSSPTPDQEYNNENMPQSSYDTDGVLSSRYSDGDDHIVAAQSTDHTHNNNNEDSDYNSTYERADDFSSQSNPSNLALNGPESSDTPNLYSNDPSIGHERDRYWTPPDPEPCIPQQMMHQPDPEATLATEVPVYEHTDANDEADEHASLNEDEETTGDEVLSAPPLSTLQEFMAEHGIEVTPVAGDSSNNTKSNFDHLPADPTLEYQSSDNKSVSSSSDTSKPGEVSKDAVGADNIEENEGIEQQADENISFSSTHESEPNDLQDADSVKSTEEDAPCVDDDDDDKDATASVKSDYRDAADVVADDCNDDDEEEDSSDAIEVSVDDILPMVASNVKNGIETIEEDQELDTEHLASNMQDGEDNNNARGITDNTNEEYDEHDKYRHMSHVQSSVDDDQSSVATSAVNSVATDAITIPATGNATLRAAFSKIDLSSPLRQPENKRSELFSKSSYEARNGQTIPSPMASITTTKVRSSTLGERSKDKLSDDETTVKSENRVVSAVVMGAVKPSSAKNVYRHEFNFNTTEFAAATTSASVPENVATTIEKSTRSGGNAEYASTNGSSSSSNGNNGVLKDEKSTNKDTPQSIAAVDKKVQFPYSDNLHASAASDSESNVSRTDTQDRQEAYMSRSAAIPSVVVSSSNAATRKHPSLTVETDAVKNNGSGNNNISSSNSVHANNTTTATENDKAYPSIREVESSASSAITPSRVRKSRIESYNGRRSTGEAEAGKHSGRIRFRDPFPVLRPPVAPRSADLIIAENSVEMPPCPVRWMKPKQDLKQLIVAAMGSSLHRRSNACGALKVITKNKVNQMKLLRTDSFLSALIFAASQSIPARGDQEAALTARTRATACIQNVCQPKENRVLVLTHPGAVECLLKVINEDRGEARCLACGAFVLIAKAPTCREELLKTDGLLEVLAEVAQGKAILSLPVTPSLTPGKKKRWSKSKRDTDKEDDDDDASVVSHSSSSSDGTGETEGDNDDTNEDDTASVGSSSSCSTMSSAVSDEESKAEAVEVSEMRKKVQAVFLEKSATNACAVLIHLSKHCSVVQTMCRNNAVMDSLIYIASDLNNHLRSKALEILCNFTRFPANNAIMVPYPGLVDVLVHAANSVTSEDRRYTLRTLQNMSSDSSSRLLLANDVVLSLLTASAMRSNEEEKEAAVASLYNITTEPGAVVALTNTKNVVATLVHLAHNPESSTTVRLLSCEALATISLWLQTLAGTGKVPQEVSNVPLPTQKTTGWDRWD